MSLRSPIFLFFMFLYLYDAIDSFKQNDIDFNLKSKFNRTIWNQIEKKCNLIC